MLRKAEKFGSQQNNKTAGQVAGLTAPKPLMEVEAALVGTVSLFPLLP